MQIDGLCPQSFWAGRTCMEMSNFLSYSQRMPMLLAQGPHLRSTSWGYPMSITFLKSRVFHMLTVDSGLSRSHILQFGVNSSCNSVAIKNMNYACTRRLTQHTDREKGTWWLWLKYSFIQCFMAYKVDPHLLSLLNLRITLWGGTAITTWSSSPFFRSKNKAQRS